MTEVTKSPQNGENKNGGQQSVETKPKKPGKLREILANTFGIGAKDYHDRLAQYVESLPDDPEKAATEIEAEADNVIREETEATEETLDKDADTLDAMVEDGNIDHDVAQAAKQKIEALKDTAKKTAVATNTKIKKPSIWSKLKEVFAGSSDHIERVAAHADEIADRMEISAEIKKAKKLSNADIEVFNAIKSFSGSDASRKKEIANYLNATGQRISDNLREFLGNAAFLPTDEEIQNPDTIINTNRAKEQKPEETPPVDTPIPTEEPKAEVDVEAITTTEEEKKEEEEEPKFKTGQKVRYTTADGKTKEYTVLGPSLDRKPGLILQEENGHTFAISADSLSRVEAITTTEEEKEEEEDPIIAEQLRKISEYIPPQYKKTKLNEGIANAARELIHSWNVIDGKDYFQNPHQLQEAVRQVLERYKATDIEREDGEITPDMGGIIMPETETTTYTPSITNVDTKPKTETMEQKIVKEQTAKILALIPKNNQFKTLIADEARKLIDAWNRADSKDYFSDQNQLKEAIKQATQKIETQMAKLGKLSDETPDFFANDGEDELPANNSETKNENMTSWDERTNTLTLDSGDQINLTIFGLRAKNIPNTDANTTKLDIIGKDGSDIFTMGIKKETNGNFTIFAQKISKDESGAVSGLSEDEIPANILKAKIENLIKDMLDQNDKDNYGGATAAAA